MTAAIWALAPLTPPRAEAERQSSTRKAGSTARTRADNHLRAGLAHYEAHDFRRALGEFRAGYKLDRRPAFLFAMAQAKRLRGDCAGAVSLYRRFIATAPPARQVVAARMHADACSALLKTESGARGGKPPPAPMTERKPAPPWYHDLAGDTLLGAGTTATLVGAGLLWSSRSAADHAAWAETYPEYDLALTRARRSRTWGVVAVGTGVTLLAGAVLRFHRRSAARHREAPTLAMTPTRGGVSLCYGGRF